MDVKRASRPSRGAEVMVFSALNRDGPSRMAVGREETREAGKVVVVPSTATTLTCEAAAIEEGICARCCEVDGVAARVLTRDQADLAFGLASMEYSWAPSREEKVTVRSAGSKTDGIWMRPTLEDG